MKKNIFLLLLFFTNNLKAQDKTFSYIGELQNDSTVKKIADSLKKPLLISGNKIYAIGSACITRLIDGDVNDRDDDGNINDRDKDDNANDRKKDGAISKRKKKGKNNNRDNDGDINDRENDADVNKRNNDGAVGAGSRCDITKKGKLLLYTRQKIETKEAYIFYKNQKFNNKSFKIIKL